MFDEKDKALQGICSLMFWAHRTASAATDVAMGTSLQADPVGDLANALERIHAITEDWLREIDPRRLELMLKRENGCASALSVTPTSHNHRS